jgi:hypothetical protein
MDPMATFDPQAVRQAIEAGRMILSVDESIEKFRPNAVGNAAVSSLGAVIAAWLVGERARVADSLCNVIAWLEDAESRNEQFGEQPWFHALRRKRALAIARWMSEGEEQRELWRAAARLGDQVWESEQVPARTFAEVYLADHLLDCLLGGEPQRGVEAWDRLAAGKSGVPDDAVFAAQCCRALAGRRPSKADLRARAEEFLRRNIGEWLGNGAYVRAAAWLAFVYGVLGGMHDPEAVLLKGYNAMPDVEMPPELQARDQSATR